MWCVLFVVLKETNGDLFRLTVLFL